jgi:hypothetical protein
MAQNNNTRGAMGRDPSLPETSKRGNWKYNGQWVNKEGFRVDGYGKVLPNQKTPFVAAKENPFAPKVAPPTTQKKEGPPAPPTAQDNINTGMDNLVQQGLTNAQNFDPNTFQQNYEPQFEQGMQRAYDTIYNQFERKNQDIFARQNEQLQQSLVERGLDPNSPAYAALTKQLSEQQASARQDAQTAAWNAAQGYQQQGFTQATGTALLPGQMAAPYLDLYGQRQGFQQQTQERLGSQAFTAEQANLQRTFEADMKRRQMEHERAIKRMGGGGGGNLAAETAWNNYMMNQYGNGSQNNTGQNPYNAGMTGFLQGASGYTQGRLNRA